MSKKIIWKLESCKFNTDLGLYLCDLILWLDNNNTYKLSINCNGKAEKEIACIEDIKRELRVYLSEEDISKLLEGKHKTNDGPSSMR